MADIPRKVVVMTGNGNMGLSITRRLANGHCLLLADYSDANRKAATATLRSEGHSVESHVLDFVEYGAVYKLAEAAANSGQIDAMIDLESTNPAIAYGLAKRGNQLQVQGAARAWGVKGVKGARLNSVSPGVISTALAQKELEGLKGDGMRAIIGMSAARRLGTPDDIANVVAFLAGPDSGFIIVNDVLVDGGIVSGRRWHAA